MKNTGFFTGLWWLPESPEVKCYGTLTIDEENIANLNLLLSPFGCSIQVWGVYKQITGLVLNASDKNDYTFHLINPAVSGNVNTLNISSINYTSSEYLSERGSHSSSSLTYTGIKLYVDIMGAWIEPIEINLFKNEKMSIGVDVREKQITDNIGNIVNYKSKWINVELEDEISIKEILEIINSLENLFTLVLRGQIKFTSIELRDKKGREYEYCLANRKKEFVLNKSSKASIDFVDFKNSSQKIIDNWLQKRGKLKIIINSFLTAYGNKSMYPESKFLSYISLLERYHKLKFKDYNPKGKRYQRMYNKVLAQLTGDCRSWVEKRLSEKSEVFLRNRLKDLMQKGILHISEETLNQFISTRNFLVHLDDSIGNALNDIELKMMNWGLEIEIIQIFYKEIQLK